MYKLLTAVFLSFTFSSAFAMDLDLVNPNYSVKNILRSKMWYEGLDVQTSDTAPMLQKQAAVDLTVQMPEELSVALDKLDS